jgi:integrase/recombinase XerD
VSPDNLLVLAGQHLALIRPRAATHPNDIRQDRSRFGYARNLLRDFVRFWCAKDCVWPITSALVFDWVSEGSTPGHPHRDLHRWFVIRRFLIHLRTVEPATPVPQNIFRSPPRRNPRLLSDQEVVNLMAATRRLCPGTPFRRLTLTTLLGLLASTGLRIGEALRLRAEEAHLDADPPHLVINDTKFGKSRVVVLHPTAVEHLRHYARESATSNASSEASFFRSRMGKPLSRKDTQRTLQRLVRHAGLESAAGEQAVTFHCFRHSFAVNRLRLWYQTGQNVTELLPHLTVYLGHADPRDTYWYLTATTDLLASASARFETNHEQGELRR